MKTNIYPGQCHSSHEDPSDKENPITVNSSISSIIFNKIEKVFISFSPVNRNPKSGDKLVRESSEIYPTAKRGYSFFKSKYSPSSHKKNNRMGKKTETETRKKKERGRY